MVVIDVDAIALAKLMVVVLVVVAWIGTVTTPKCSFGKSVANNVFESLDKLFGGSNNPRLASMLPAVAVGPIANAFALLAAAGATAVPLLSHLSPRPRFLSRFTFFCCFWLLAVLPPPRLHDFSARLVGIDSDMESESVITSIDIDEHGNGDVPSNMRELPLKHLRLWLSSNKMSLLAKERLVFG